MSDNIAFVHPRGEFVPWLDQLPLWRGLSHPGSKKARASKGRSMPFGGMEKAAIWVLGLLDLVAHIALPVLVPWGWIRWAKGTRRRSVCAVLSLIGFTLASLSFLLGITSVLYTGVIGGFAYYDPRLMRIFRWGFLLSVAAFAFGISGVWRPNPLRWQAPVCALGMLMVWFGWAMAE